AKEALNPTGIYFQDCLGIKPEILTQEIEVADIVVLHWWNHPLLYFWLINGRWSKARLLVWSHVSGHKAPQIIIPEIVDFADIFAITTPHSLSTEALKMAGGLKNKKIKVHAHCGGLSHVEGINPRPHQNFRIGYIGTVDKQKMHPEFVAMSVGANIDDAVFVVAGGPDHEILRSEVAALGLSHKFEILGELKDVRALLSTLDVFGYPLNPNHYGTMELALLEAQAAQIPPVVLGGGAEEFLITHGLNGLVADGPADYSQKLKLLRDNGQLRQNLAEAAKKKAEEFTLEKTIIAFDALYAALLETPKTPKQFLPHQTKLAPHEVFLLSQGTESAPFKTLMAKPNEATSKIDK
ncbi:MAG: glycosyltransferase, partial [Candidatus Adiutrix sp.]